MKQYVIDELRPNDHHQIETYLNDHFQAGALEGVYRLILPETILNAIQREHVDCQPFYLSIELEPQRMTGELLVRSSNVIRCNCIGYANELQRNWFIERIDDLLEHLNIQI